MKKLLFGVGVVCALGSTAVLAEPTAMDDEQMADVTAGATGWTFTRITNLAGAINNVSTTGGSASASCIVGCVAINISVLSGNIIGRITQTSTATASSSK